VLLHDEQQVERAIARALDAYSCEAEQPFLLNVNT